jgi:hypothetical protein
MRPIFKNILLIILIAIGIGVGSFFLLNGNHWSEILSLPSSININTIHKEGDYLLVAGRVKKNKNSNSFSEYISDGEAIILRIDIRTKEYKKIYFSKNSGIIKLSKLNDDVLYALELRYSKDPYLPQSYILVSNNMGLSWMTLSKPLNNKEEKFITINCSFEKCFYGWTDEGKIYASFDKGKNWQCINLSDVEPKELIREQYSSIVDIKGDLWVGFGSKLIRVVQGGEQSLEVLSNGFSIQKLGVSPTNVLWLLIKNPENKLILQKRTSIGEYENVTDISKLCSDFYTYSIHLNNNCIYLLGADMGHTVPNKMLLVGNDSGGRWTSEKIGTRVMNESFIIDKYDNIWSWGQSGDSYFLYVREK